MLTDMVTTMANGFVVSVTQDLVEVSCPCPARYRVQQLCTVRYKATRSPLRMCNAQPARENGGIELRVISMYATGLTHSCIGIYDTKMLVEF